MFVNTTITITTIACFHHRGGSGMVVVENYSAPLAEVPEPVALVLR